MKLIPIAEKIGTATISKFENFGETSLFFFKTLKSFFAFKNFSFQNLIAQIVRIGYESMSVIAFTSFFMGMVIAFSTGVYLNTKITGIGSYTGGGLTVSFTREIGPVLTGLLIAGRSGSSVAAEIGSMVVTEQVDAMISMGVRPVEYLVVPRTLAGIISFPVLTLIADLLAIIGGSFIAHIYLHQSFAAYYRNVLQMLTFDQIYLGFIKSLFFGFLVIFVSCARGYFVKGGSESVGKATTDAVVTGSITIVIVDFLITSLSS